VIGECRIDMAFVGRDHIAGIEIKSSRDKTDRLAKQVEAYRVHLPEVWLVAAEKWGELEGVPWSVGRLTYTRDGALIPGAFSPHGRFPHPARIDRAITVPMLDLLWRAEIGAVARRYRIETVRRDTIPDLKQRLARALTGDEIVSGVCAQLRSRSAFPASPVSDPPISVEAPL
jgi:hypothetical protein